MPAVPYFFVLKSLDNLISAPCEPYFSPYTSDKGFTQFARFAMQACKIAGNLDKRTASPKRFFSTELTEQSCPRCASYWQERLMMMRWQAVCGLDRLRELGCAIKISKMRA
jgi:hypothetical protein